MTTMTVKAPAGGDAGEAFRRALRRNLTALRVPDAAALICFAFFSWYPMVREFLLASSRRDFVDAPPGSAWTTSVRSSEDPAFAQAWSTPSPSPAWRSSSATPSRSSSAIVLNELRHAQAYLRFSSTSR